MKRVLAVSLVVMLALVACQGRQTTIDQAIQYRAAFNAAVGSFYSELQALPQAQQKDFASKAVPIVTAGKLALDTMDSMVGAGQSITPDQVQAFLAAKNQMLDLLASIVVAKGGK